MSDVKKEVDRVKNQVVAVYDKTDVRTRNIVFGVLLAFFILGILFVVF